MNPSTSSSSGISPAPPHCSHQPVTYSPSLHRFSVLLVILTFVLILSGGNVTSKGAGLAVPDWPTTFDYNMFTYPIEFWTGGVFHEHVHRLKGSLIGLLTIILTFWLWKRENHRPWLCATGTGLLILVIIQGIMGGLRVTEISTALAIVHGVVGQVFFSLTVLTAAATSHWWIHSLHPSSSTPTSPPPHGLRNRRQAVAGWVLLLWILIFTQLVIGAALRQTKSSLAIPDFPLSYNRLIPPFSQPDINAAIAKLPPETFADRWNTLMVEPHYTTAQVAAAYTHRTWAIVVALATWFVLRRAWNVAQNDSLLTRPILFLAASMILQILLGALVIWTSRYPWLASAHHTLGAAILAVTGLLALRLTILSPTTQTKIVSSSRPAATPALETAPA